MEPAKLLVPELERMLESKNGEDGGHGKEPKKKAAKNNRA